MSAPSHLCDAFREDFLAGQATAQELDCAPCRSWLQRAGLVQGLLGSLERQVAPEALGEALAEAIEVGACGQESLLKGGLQRLSAPGELELRLAAELKGDPSQPAWAPALAGLEPRRAPEVLGRLVDEELREPAAAVVRRFAGGLFRLTGPRSLADHIDRDLREAPRRTRSLGLSLGSAAAAVLLVWVVLPQLGGTTKGQEPRLSFRVVEVDDLDGLDPFARSLVEGLAGGKVRSVPPLTDQRPDDPRRGSTTDGGGR
jgi:hypothetical protein